MKKVFRASVYISGVFGVISMSAFAGSVFFQMSTLGYRMLAGILLLGMLIPLFFKREWFSALPKHLTATVSYLYAVVMIFYTVTYLIMLGVIFGFAVSAPAVEDNAVILAYGCRVHGTTPGVVLEERLDTVYTLMCEYPDTVCIVSGAYDTGEEYSEGEVMARYLVNRGVSPDRIVIDDTAQDTKGNIRAFLSLIAENGWEHRQQISVSSDFHIPRIAFLSGKYGLTCSYVGSRDANPFAAAACYTREYLAYIKMFLRNDYT